MTRLPVPDPLLPYEVNEHGEIKSLARTIMRKNRWRSEPTPYYISERILKHDIKLSYNTKLARVQLYCSDPKYRLCYYISKLVYAVHNNRNYNDLRNIHYIDGDSLNSELYNLYETE
jgi:hypothetical protein